MFTFYICCSTKRSNTQLLCGQTTQELSGRFCIAGNVSKQKSTLCLLVSHSSVAMKSCYKASGKAPGETCKSLRIKK